MSKNEIELIQIISNSKNPEQSIMKATIIIIDFLKQHGSSEEQAAAYPPELC